MKRYLFMTLTFTLAFCLVVSVVNYVVDPYAIYHYDTKDVARLNRIDQFYQMRLTKPWHVVVTNPTAIVIGSSKGGRVPPEFPDWPQDSSYNLSVPGMTPYEMLRFIEHAQANGPISKLMIGLDFETFIVTDPLFQSGYSETRLVRTKDELTSPGFLWHSLSDATDTLLSLASFTRSLAAVTGTAIVSNDYAPDGTWEVNSSGNFGRTAYTLIGKNNVFSRRDEQLEFEPNLKILADILRFAHQQKIETRLFVTPEHVFLIDLWVRLGYGKLWREFHRQLVALNDSVATEMDAKPFPLFGFNQMAGVVDEPITTAEDFGQSYFMDGLHYRKTLGEQMMSAVWGEGKGAGVELNAKTVEPYLAQVDKLRRRFEAANARLTFRLRYFISPTLNPPKKPQKPPGQSPKSRE